MRPIKFRAWDKRNKEWLYMRIDRGEFQGALLTSYNAPNDYTDWQQSTGLTDRRGKEIYEGDILLCGDGGSYFPQAYDEAADEYRDVGKYVVRWGHGDYPAFTMDIPDEVCVDMQANPLSYLHAEGTMEVIGNIYEHPELVRAG